MPFMREWTEITVDEDLLVPVVRELLDMAVNSNQVEVVHGPEGRIILAEVHLAEHWFQERLKRDAAVPEDDIKVFEQTEVVAQAEILDPPPAPVEVVEPSKIAQTATPAPAATQAEVVEPSKLAQTAIPVPVRRVPVVKTSASPKGEES